MKKFIAVIAAAAVCAGAASCNKQKTGKVPHPKPKAEENTSTQTNQLSELTTTTSQNGKTTTKKTTTTSTTTTAKATEPVTQPDPLGSGAFEYDDSGAVIFNADIRSANDKTLIAAAQALFDSACRTEWNFTVGCPYNVDMNNYIEAGSFSWRYYRITDSNISSYDDILNEYHKVFSSRYPSTEIQNLYCDSGGSAYALCGNRGANIYYSSSKIIDVKSRSDDEIVFTVENYYDGSDYDSSAHTETEEFSAVIENGNVWKAGKFKLPY